MSEVLRGQDVATNHFIFSASCVQQTKTGNRNQIKVINLHPQNETMHLSDDKKTHQTFAKYQIEDKSLGSFFPSQSNPSKLHCGVWQSLNTSVDMLTNFFLLPTISFHFYLTNNSYTFTEELLAQTTTKFTLTFSKDLLNFLLVGCFEDIIQTPIVKYQIEDKSSCSFFPYQIKPEQVAL